MDFFSHFTSIAEHVKKKFARFVFNKLVGRFLKKKVALDKIDLNAGDGRFCLNELELKEEAINDLLKGLPVQLVSASIGTVRAKIPYMNLMTEGCEIDVDQLEIVLQPCYSEDDAEWSLDPESLTQSIVHDFQEEEEEEELRTEDGLQNLAVFIQAILAKIQVSVSNLTLKIQHYDEMEDKTVSTVLHIGKGVFRDAAVESEENDTAGQQADEDTSHAATATVIEKHLNLFDIAVMLETSKGLPLDAFSVTTRSQKLLLSRNTSAGDLCIVRLHRGGATLKTEVECFFHDFNLLLSPSDIATLLALGAAFSSPSGAETSSKDKASEETESAFHLKLTLKSGGLSLLFDDFAFEARQRIASVFFQRLQDRRNASNEGIDNATLTGCGRDHLRIDFLNSNLEYRIPPPSQSISTSIRFRFGYFSVLECTWPINPQESNPSICEVFTFAPSLNSELQERNAQSIPKAQLHKSMIPRDLSQMSRNAMEVAVDISPSGNRVNLNLLPCVLTLDITILDRIQGLLAALSGPSLESTTPIPSEADVSKSISQPSTFTLNCDLLRLVAKSPIPDYTPDKPSYRPLDRPHKPEQRDEDLWIDLYGVELTHKLPYSVNDDYLSLLFTVEFQTCIGYVWDTRHAFPYLHSTSINCFREAKLEVKAREQGNKSPTAMLSSADLPSPFASKFTATQGREQTMHAANNEETQKFLTATEERSEYQVDILLPNVKAHLPFDRLQMLYGLVIDISMWEPWVYPVEVMDPIPAMETPQTHVTSSKDNEEIDSDLDSSDDEDGFTELIPMPKKRKHLCHLASVGIRINSANIILENEVIVEDKVRRDHFEMDVKNALIFAAVGFNESLRKYILIRLEDLKMSEEVNGVRHEIVRKNTRDIGETGNMLSVVVDMDVNPDTKFKTMVVAVDIGHTFFTHRTSFEHWIFRLIALSDLIDPVYPYYELPGRFMRLNLHFINVLLKYQPIQLPSVAMLSFSAIHLSANIVPLSSSLTLKFIFEHAGVYLIDDALHLHDTQTDDPEAQGFAQMVNDRMLELTIESCSDGSQPSLQIILGNHEAEITTCRDSLPTFVNTLMYYLGGDDYQVMDPETYSIDNETPRDSRSVTPTLSESINTVVGDESDQLKDMQEVSQEVTDWNQQAMAETTGTSVFMSAITGLSSSSSDSEPAHPQSDSSSVNGSPTHDNIDARHTDSPDEGSQNGYYNDSDGGSPRGERTEVEESISEPKDGEEGSEVEDEIRESIHVDFERDDDDYTPTFEEYSGSDVSENNDNSDDEGGVDDAEGSDRDGEQSYPYSGSDSSCASSRHLPQSPDVNDDHDSPTPDLPGDLDSSLAHGIAQRFNEQQQEESAEAKFAAELERGLNGSSNNSSKAMGVPILLENPEIGDVHDVVARDMMEALAERSPSPDEFHSAITTVEDSEPLFDPANFNNDFFASSNDTDNEPSGVPGRQYCMRAEAIDELAMLDTVDDEIDSDEDLDLSTTASLMADALRDCSPTTTSSQPVVSPVMSTPGVPNGKVTMKNDGDRLELVHDHFPLPSDDNSEALKPDKHFPSPTSRIILRGVAVSWKMLHGKDWHTYQLPEENEDDVPGTPSEGTSAPGSNNVQRSDECLQVCLNNLTMAYDTFPDDTDFASRLKLSIQQLEIIDRLRVSYLNKFLTDYKSKERARESGSSMIRFELLFVRTPGMEVAAEEAMIGLSILPLRLNVDQDALDFVVLHLAGLASSPDTEEASDSDEEDKEASEPVSDKEPTEESTPIYIKFCFVDSLYAVIDYEPKRVKYQELLRGDLSELKGWLPLYGSIISTDKVTIRGVEGFGQLGKAIGDAWIAHAVNQVPGIMTGLPGVRPVVNVAGAGLGILQQPFRQYPRVVTGVRDGLSDSFQTTAVELCNIGTTLAFGMQTAFEVVQGVLSHEEEQQVFEDRSRFARQPLDVQSGFMQAKHVLLDGARAAYRKVVVQPNEQRTDRPIGTGMVIARTVGAIPSAGLQPFISLCEAVSLSLQGIRNTINPLSRTEFEEKYR